MRQRRSTECRHARSNGWATLFVVVSLVVALGVALPAEAEKKRKKGYTGTGAGIGALLGLALGSGNVLEDAAAGAALGAAGGAIASAATRDKRERQYAEEQAAEAEKQQSSSSAQKQDDATQAQLAAQQAQLAELQRELQTVAAARDSMQDDIIAAIGPDNWEGYKALRGCQHARALALAGAGATSSNVTYQLASIWLEAMVAADSRDSSKAEKNFERLVANDPDIDTVQQASLATDQAVLDLRDERREIGIGSCQ